MKAGDIRILIRGGGELASATAQHLYQEGYRRILILERRYPKAVRRNVCFSEAVLEGSQQVGSVVARLAADLQQVDFIHRLGDIAIAVMPVELALREWHPDVFIEAAMLRRNWGLSQDMAPVVIALGPGYVAGQDCHAVIDTTRGPQVGSVHDDPGAMLKNEPPADIMGFKEERAVKAARSGIFFTRRGIGEEVERGERVGTVVSIYGIDDFRRGVPVDASYSVTARIGGVVRGLLRDGVPVKTGDRIGDVDPRGRTEDIDHVSDKAHRVAEGVHEALLNLLDQIPPRQEQPPAQPAQIDT
jgi:xanthine dehydrogenase accessory factor